jgi:hypothetical protein
MQPQDTGFDLGHWLSAFGGAIIGGVSSIFGLIYWAGGRDPKLKADFQRSLTDAEERVKDKIDEVERRAENKMTSVAGDFDETLKGLRQKINDVELETERSFLKKDEFGEFRNEYRQDMQRIFNKLDSLPNGRRQ